MVDAGLAATPAPFSFFPAKRRFGRQDEEGRVMPKFMLTKNVMFNMWQEQGAVKAPRCNSQDKPAIRERLPAAS